jgi:hypothetical protein
MVRRVEPGIEMFLVAGRPGVVRLAGGLEAAETARIIEYTAAWRANAAAFEAPAPAT